MSVLFNRLKETNGSFNTYAEVLSGLERQQLSLGNVYLQLTPLCNLSCTMCYAKMTLEEVHKTGQKILRFNEWKNYIDSFLEMGVSDISFTGGECTIHPDFERIYRYAYDLGFGIAILTNGSQISDELYELFIEKPPACIAVTVYGSKEGTYQQLCKNKQAYSEVFKNVVRLIQGGFNVKVKYTIVQENIKDLQEVYEFFEKYGIELRYQTHLLKFNNADEETISKVVVDEEEIKNIEKQMFGDKYQTDNDEYDIIAVKAYRNRRKLPKNGVRCAAGQSICHIRWDGQMTPCVSLETCVRDPRIIGFEKAWKNMNQWAQAAPVIEECDHCVHLLKCPSCIALHYNDTNVEGIPSPRFCWKRNHPQEAKAIEKRLVEKGLISFGELNEIRKQ